MPPSSVTKFVLTGQIPFAACFISPSKSSSSSYRDQVVPLMHAATLGTAWAILCSNNHSNNTNVSKTAQVPATKSKCWSHKQETRTKTWERQQSDWGTTTARARASPNANVIILIHWAHPVGGIMTARWILLGNPYSIEWVLTRAHCDKGLRWPTKELKAIRVVGSWFESFVTTWTRERQESDLLIYWVVFGVSKSL